MVPYIDSLKDLTGQKGCVFYVNPWNTSHIDPTTGFMNLFKFPKNNVQFWKEFFNCMDSIKYDTENSYFVFAFKYSKFKNLVRCKDFIDRWKVCSYGERLYNKKSGKNWITEKIDPTEEIARLLNDSKIYFEDGHELKDEIVEKMTKIKSFGWLFRQIINLRNSRINSDEDFILSPVKNSDNKFFDSRYASQLQPCDADANGSYHIALKGLQITEENIICETDTTYKLESPKKPNEEWAKWIQEFHQR